MEREEEVTKRRDKQQDGELDTSQCRINAIIFKELDAFYQHSTITRHVSGLSWWYFCVIVQIEYRKKLLDIHS